MAPFLILDFREKNTTILSILAVDYLTKVSILRSLPPREVDTPCSRRCRPIRPQITGDVVQTLQQPANGGAVLITMD